MLPCRQFHNLNLSPTSASISSSSSSAARVSAAGVVRSHTLQQHPSWAARRGQPAQPAQRPRARAACLVCKAAAGGSAGNGSNGNNGDSTGSSGTNGSGRDALASSSAGNGGGSSGSGGGSPGGGNSQPYDDGHNGNGRPAGFSLPLSSQQLSYAVLGLAALSALLLLAMLRQAAATSSLDAAMQTVLASLVSSCHTTHRSLIAGRLVVARVHCRVLCCFAHFPVAIVCGWLAYGTSVQHSHTGPTRQPLPNPHFLHRVCGMLWLLAGGDG